VEGGKQRNQAAPQRQNKEATHDENRGINPMVQGHPAIANSLVIRLGAPTWWAC
jgi:hypothetical protein